MHPNFASPRFIFTLGVVVAYAPAVSLAQTALSTDGTYDTTGIDQNTTEASTFNTMIANAWSNDLGGAIDFADYVDVTDSFTSTFGTSGTLTLNMSTSTTMQSALDTGSFDPLTTRAFLQSSNTSGWTLNFDSVSGGSPDLAVNEVGFTLIPRTSGDYPLDVDITVTFSDLTTATDTVTLGDNKTTSDFWFFGYDAPSGQSISSINFDSAPTSTRIAIDQLGYTVAVIPEPGTAAGFLGFAALLFALRRRRG